MRTPIRITIALLSVFANVVIFAQNRETSSLAEQIREQEIATTQPAGKRDGQAWLKLAILQQNAAHYRDAERAYRTAIALLNSGDRRILANAMDSMGAMYAECGAFSKAERLERKALAIREHEHDAPGIGLSHMHLSALLIGRGQLSSAQPEAELGVKLLVPTATPEQQMSALINLSVVQCARGDCFDALPQLRRALDIAHRNYAADSIPVGLLDFLLGYASWKSGDDHSAEDLMRKGTQELSTQLAWGHPMYLRAMRQYGTFLTQTGRTADADEVWARIAKFGSPRAGVDLQSFLMPYRNARSPRASSR